MRLIDLAKLKPDDFVLLESNRHQSIIARIEVIKENAIIINGQSYCRHSGNLQYSENSLSIRKFLKSRKQFIKAKRRVIITDPDILLNRVLFKYILVDR